MDKLVIKLGEKVDDKLRNGSEKVNQVNTV